MLVNAYKEAWLAEVMLDYAQSRHIAKSTVASKKKRKMLGAKDAAQIGVRMKAEASVLKGAHELMKHASQSQIKGRIGIGLRVGGRIGTRLIPIVGTAMLAYDVYQAYQYLTE